jgi:hypothetical protein
MRPGPAETTLWEVPYKTEGDRTVAEPKMGMEIGMRFRWVALIWTLALAPSLSGQELQLRLSAASMSRGASGSASIELKTPAGREPAAVEWELAFPVQQVDIQDADWSPGAATQAAQKQLSCVRQLRREPEAYSYKCVLAGGRTTLRGGVVAVVKFKIPASAAQGVATLSLTGVVGALPDARKLDIKPAKATLAIR